MTARLALVLVLASLPACSPALREAEGPAAIDASARTAAATRALAECHAFAHEAATNVVGLSVWIRAGASDHMMPPEQTKLTVEDLVVDPVFAKELGCPAGRPKLALVVSDGARAWTIPSRGLVGFRHAADVTLRRVFASSAADASRDGTWDQFALEGPGAVAQR